MNIKSTSLYDYYCKCYNSEFLSLIKTYNFHLKIVKSFLKGQNLIKNLGWIYWQKGKNKTVAKKGSSTVLSKTSPLV